MSQKGEEERWSRKKKGRKKEKDEEMNQLRQKKSRREENGKEMTLGKRKPDRQTQGTRLLLVHQRSRPAVAWIMTLCAIHLTLGGGSVLVYFSIVSSS